MLKQKTLHVSHDPYLPMNFDLLNLSFLNFLFPPHNSIHHRRAAFLKQGLQAADLERQVKLTRLRKTALARPITHRQSTLHVIVLGIHA